MNYRRQLPGDNVKARMTPRSITTYNPDIGMATPGLGRKNHFQTHRGPRTFQRHTRVRR